MVGPRGRAGDRQRQEAHTAVSSHRHHHRTGVSEVVAERRFTPDPQPDRIAARACAEARHRVPVPPRPAARVVSTVDQRPPWAACRSTILPPGGNRVPSVRRRPEKRTVPAPRSRRDDAWIVALAATRSETLRVRPTTPSPPPPTPAARGWARPGRRARSAQRVVRTDGSATGAAPVWRISLYRDELVGERGAVDRRQAAGDGVRAPVGHRGARVADGPRPRADPRAEAHRGHDARQEIAGAVGRGEPEPDPRRRQRPRDRRHQASVTQLVGRSVNATRVRCAPPASRRPDRERVRDHRVTVRPLTTRRSSTGAVPSATTARSTAAGFPAASWARKVTVWRPSASVANPRGPAGAASR